MIIRYVYQDGHQAEIKKGYNYLLPIKTILIISECDYIIVNDKRRILSSGELYIEYNGEELDLEYENTQYKIRSYGQMPNDDVRFEYCQFDKCFRTLLNSYNNNMPLHDYLKTLNCESVSEHLSLCTFGRNVDEMRKDTSLSEIIKYLKNLKQVFSRPKSHLREEMELLPVEVVSRISHETIQHLVSHSENCEARRVNGIVPSRLLAKNLEEDIAIYENIVAKTLVDRLYNYIRRYQRNVKVAEQSIKYSLAINNECRNVYTAQHILHKGYSSENFYSNDKKNVTDSDFTLLDDRLKQCKEILSAIAFCRESKLYRILKKAKKATSPLKPTNIFMMDTKYKSVYLLWKILDFSEQHSEKVSVPNDIRTQYFDFSLSMIHFALNHFNFVSNDNIALTSNLFNQCHYTFSYWKCDVLTEYIQSMSLSSVIMRFSLTNEYKMPFHFEDIDEAILSKHNANKNGIIFGKIPTDKEVETLCESIYPNQHKHDVGAALKRRDLKQCVTDYFTGKSEQTVSIMLIPIPLCVCQTEHEFDNSLSFLKNMAMQTICSENLNYCYFLIPQRPSDDEDLSNKTWSKKLISYPRIEIKEQFGILPITISDIDSYRRLTKIFLRHMIEIDTNHSYCPICGSPTIFNNGRWYCNMCEPEFEIRTPICSCGEKYTVTHYKQSYSQRIKGIDDITNEFEAIEIKGGFKNFTDIDEKMNPICPFCGEIK